MTRRADPPTTEPCPGAPVRAPTRRAVIAAAAGLAAGSGLGRALAQEPPPLPVAGAAFNHQTLVALAQARARAPYAAPPDDLPAALKALSREDYARIRTAPGSAVWAGDDLGFTLEPLHRGSLFVPPVAVFLVEDGVVRPLPYDAARFAPEGVNLPALPPEAGYSGLRLKARFDGDEPADFAVFQGASFFRLAAKGQRFGVNARALTLRPADARGEEFPLWRALFVERPARGGPVVVHALVESASVAGALRLTLTPGARASIADVEVAVFAREAVDHLGHGGMQGSFLFGAIDRRNVDDARARVHAVDGLRLRNGAGEAIWRPVHNPDTLQISSFLDRAPRGFGLMQRARAFDDYEDDVRHWELRPSLWLEPAGDWGTGAVALLEIPSDSELNENILAYWRPDGALAAGQESRHAYRQHWCWQPPDVLALAVVSCSRGGRGSRPGRRLFLVDFAGEGLFPAEGLEIGLSAAPGAIHGARLVPDPGRGSVRARFELDPGGEKAVELRLALHRDGRAVTETWLYRWTP